MAIRETFGEKLKENIERKFGPRGMREFARCADIHRGHLYDILKGEASPSLATAERIAKTLGVDLAELIEE